MSRATFLLAACCAVALLAVQPAPTQSTTSFVVGFAEDLPKEIGTQATDPARVLGATAFRLTTQWSAGQTQLDAAEVTRLDRAVAAAAGLRVFLSVYGTAGTATPRDPAARDAYCGFVRDVLLRYGAVRDIVIWNEPNKRLFWNPQLAADGSSLAPAEYEALLARCYDVLHGAVPGVRVLGLALSSTGNDDAGSHSPGSFIRKVGDAYRASGRTAPVLDAVVLHPYVLTPDERPWTRHTGATTIGEGDWNKLMSNLSLAFAGTGQPLPGKCSGSVCPVIWYLESGFQTIVDPAKAASYTGTENVPRVLAPDAGGEPDTAPPAAGSAAPDQRTQILDATRLAACQPFVAGILNFLLADEPRLAGWQSGALWADRTVKPSAAAFGTAFAAATAGSIDCDALKGGRPSADYAPPPAPSALTASPAEEPLRIDIQWSVVSDPSAPVQYSIYRDGVLLTTTSTASWTDTAIVRSRTYRYVVRAIDAAGNLGDATAPADAVTPGTAPPSGGGEGGSGGGGGGGGVPAALSVGLEAPTGDLVPGQDVEIRVRVVNAPGAQTAVDAGATISLPDGVTLLGPPSFERGQGCTGSPVVVCLLDFLPAGMETPIRFWVDVGDPGVRQIRVDVSAGNDGSPADNTAAATLSIRAPGSSGAGGTAVKAVRKGVRRFGTARADRLVGTDYADLLRGGGGGDSLIGLGGNDTLVGGAGRDTISAGPGNDRIVVRDGSRDVVACGPGRDTVVADRVDAVAGDCEIAGRT